LFAEGAGASGAFETVWPTLTQGNAKPRRLACFLLALSLFFQMLKPSSLSSVGFLKGGGMGRGMTGLKK